MDFIDVTCDVDVTVNSLDYSSQKNEPAKKMSIAQRASDEQSAKTRVVESFNAINYPKNH